MSDFDAELAVEQLEASAFAATRDHAIGSWHNHLEGRQGGVRMPAALGGSTARRTLSRLQQRSCGFTRALARRIEMLWRLHVHAALEADDAVEESSRALAELASDDRQGWREGMRDLFRARNRAARRLGWPGFIELSARLGELDGLDAAALLQAADRSTRVAWHEAGDGGLGCERPDMEIEVSTPDPVRALGYLVGLGLNLGQVRVDLVSAAPGRESRTYLIEPPRDVRVVVARGRGLASWRTLWHELGHAVYAVGVEAKLPWPLAGAPARCLDEGVAELFADLGETETCLVDLFGLAPEAAVALCVRRRTVRLAWQRWQLARTAFERDAYRDPDADLASRWVALVREYVGEAADRELAPWAELSHLRTDPGSQLSYLLADRIRCVLGWRLSLHEGASMSREAAGLLAGRLFRLGASRRWHEVLFGLVGGCGLAV